MIFCDVPKLWRHKKIGFVNGLSHLSQIPMVLVNQLAGWEMDVHPPIDGTGMDQWFANGSCIDERVTRCSSSLAKVV